MQCSGFRVEGPEFGVQGSGFRVQGSECRVQDAGFRVQGLGGYLERFRVFVEVPPDVVWPVALVLVLLDFV